MTNRAVRLCVESRGGEKGCLDYQQLPVSQVQRGRNSNRQILLPQPICSVKLACQPLRGLGRSSLRCFFVILGSMYQGRVWAIYGSNRNILNTCENKNKSPPNTSAAALYRTQILQVLQSKQDQYCSLWLRDELVLSMVSTSRRAPPRTTCCFFNRE